MKHVVYCGKVSLWRLNKTGYKTKKTGMIQRYHSR